MFFYNGLM